MQRREFMMFVGGAAAVLPHATHAQQAARIYRLGVMNASKIGVSRIAAFFDELRLLGFVEGQNLKVDGRGYGLRDEQLPEIVAAMAKSPPDVIFCATAAEMRAAQGAIRAMKPRESLVAQQAVTPRQQSLFFEPAGGPEGWTASVWPQSTDARGRFRFSNVPPGDYLTTNRFGLGGTKLFLETLDAHTSLDLVGPIRPRFPRIL
jgi:hypothetical protein